MRLRGHRAPGEGQAAGPVRDEVGRGEFGEEDGGENAQGGCVFKDGLGNRGQGDNVGVTGGEDDVVEFYLARGGARVEGRAEGGFVVSAAQLADVGCEVGVRMGLAESVDGGGDFGGVGGGDVDVHSLGEAEAGHGEA